MPWFQHRLFHTCLLTLALAGIAAPALGSGRIANKAFHNNALCAPAIARAERRLNIPARLLRAISLAESGRYDRRRKATIAWPWAVNAAGNANYYPTKALAIAAVRKLRARGARNIDVGCMQVNLMHHPKAFRDLNAAFDPATNVAYAAAFLKRLHARSGSWIDAVAAYHSQLANHGNPYMLRVLRIWVDRRHRTRPTQLAARRPKLRRKSGLARRVARSTARGPKHRTKRQPSRSASLVRRARALDPASPKRKWSEVVARRKRFAEWLTKRQAKRQTKHQAKPLAKPQTKR